MDTGIRCMLWDLTRHNAKKSSGYDIYALKSSDEWLEFTFGELLDGKFDAKTGDFTERFILCDPSVKLSYEEIGRRSIRAQRTKPHDVDHGIGCGNVRLVSTRKYTGLLGAEMKRIRKTFSAERVSTKSLYVITYLQYIFPLCRLYKMPYIMSPRIPFLM